MISKFIRALTELHKIDREFQFRRRPDLPMATRQRYTTESVPAYLLPDGPMSPGMIKEIEQSTQLCETYHQQRLAGVARPLDLTP